MNIFILSWLLDHCAQYHCDKHVIKLILEATQLLSTCQHVINPLEAEKWFNEGLIYRQTHVNHPCSLWVRECKENYIWLCQLGFELCKEYAYRYDKQISDHKCYSKLIFLAEHVPSLPSYGNITTPRLAMPDKYKHTDPVFSYRMYYLNEKARMLVWRKRSPPPWVPDNLCLIHYQSEQKRLLKQQKQKKIK